MRAVLDVIVIGWIVALAPAIWAFSDMGRVPRRVWFWTGHGRDPWRKGVVAAWVLGGWPAIVVAIAWWRSVARADVTAELVEIRDRHRRRQTA
jgi:hypothetical protein